MSKVALLTLPSGTIAQLSTYELVDLAKDFRVDRLAEPEVIGSRAEVEHVLGLIAQLWPLRGPVQGESKTVAALRDMVKKAQGWIPVGEKLPPYGQDVLAWFPYVGVQRSNAVEANGKAIWSPGIREWGEVTHWMSLPLKPENPS